MGRREGQRERGCDVLIRVSRVDDSKVRAKNCIKRVAVARR